MFNETNDTFHLFLINDFTGNVSDIDIYISIALIVIEILRKHPTIKQIKKIYVILLL